MKREFKVTFSSLEEAWFDNEAIVIAETKEQAFNLVKDCIDSGKNPFTVFNSKQCEVIENVHTKDYEIADGLNEIPYKDFVQEYHFLPIENGLTDIQKAQSSNVTQILEIEIDALDSDVFSLLELLNSNQIVSIKDFIDYDAKFLYGESVSSKWNQFKNFIQQSGVKYIALTKNGNLFQEAHNKLLSASSSNLYTVTVVHDFKIQYIKQFLTKEDAEKLFIDKCLYYYNEDGLEAFALTKDKALKDFDAKDFEEYFQSEQWNDCCDIANVEINIM